MKSKSGNFSVNSQNKIIEKISGFRLGFRMAFSPQFVMSLRLATTARQQYEPSRLSSAGVFVAPTSTTHCVPDGSHGQVTNPLASTHVNKYMFIITGLQMVHTGFFIHFLYPHPIGHGEDIVKCQRNLTWSRLAQHVKTPTRHYDVIDFALLLSGAVAPLSNKPKINDVIMTKRSYVVRKQVFWNKS